MNNLRLLIDANNIAWSAFHSLPEMSFDRKRTEVAFGFMKRVLGFAEMFDTNRFIFFWDSNSWMRKQIFAGYKDRDDKDDEVKQEVIHHARVQIDKLRSEVIPEFGFKNSFWIDGLEADDLIAAVSKRGDGEYMIISTDNDMLQLLDKNVRIYDHRQRKVKDLSWLYDNKGITASQWVRVKAMAGCTSDMVPGIQGVGEKTAIKYIRGELGDGKVKSRIESVDSTRLIARNKRLVELPFKIDAHYFRFYKRQIKIVPDRLKSGDFLKAFDKYRFIYFLKNFNKWENAFKFRTVYHRQRGQLR